MAGRPTTLLASGGKGAGVGSGARQLALGRQERGSWVPPLVLA